MQSNWSGPGGGGSGEVKVSVDDTTPGYLEGKLTNGYGITFNIANPGGNESLDISINNGDLDDYFALLNSTNQPFTFSGQNSLNTALRIAYDSVGSESVNWNTGQLSYSGNVRLDWQLFTLYDTYSNISQNWDQRILVNSSGFTTVNYETLELSQSGGSVKFDWGNLKFPTLTTDGFLKTSAGDGTIIIDTTTYLTTTLADTDYARLDGTNQPFTGALTYYKASGQAANAAFDGLFLHNDTDATSGNQQYSPAIHFRGEGWKTTATAASQTVDFREYLAPVQGTTAPTSFKTWESAINGGAYSTLMCLTSAGRLGMANASPHSLITVTGTTGAVCRYGWAYSSTYGQSYIQCEFSSGSQNSNTMTFYVNQIGGTGTQVLEIIGNGRATFTNSLTLNTSSGQLIAGSTTNVTTAPAIAFLGDGNTGLGHPAADTLAFVTNGAERTRITSAGNFGIGTGATVSAKLHVIQTTEQLRLGYDASNYCSVTLSSTGSCTFDLVGTSPKFTFSDPVIVSNLTSGRLVFATTSGELTDDADLTFATDTLTATKIVGTTSIKVGTAAGYLSSDGSAGATGTFTTVDLKTVTVKDGIITSIV